MRISGILAVAIVMMVAGCGGGGAHAGVEIAERAVVQGRQVLHKAPATKVVVSGEEVARLAQSAHVGEETVRTVAPTLDQQSVWQHSVKAAGSIYERVPDQVKQPIL